MSSPGPIDFHTHRDAGGILPETAPEIVRIVSTPPEFFLLPMPANTLKTLELHPWSGADIPENFELLAAMGDCSGVGEVGIDRRRGALPWPRQLEIFARLARIADALGKPLTVHCVGGYADLLAIAKNQPWRVPTILHYFCGKPELAEQLLRRENWVLSLSPASTRSTGLMAWLRAHPEKLRQIVLETDDPHGDIAAHYQDMAGIFGLAEAELRGVMRANFERIYRGAL